MPNPKPTSVMAWATIPPAGALLEPPSALVTNGYSQNSKPAYNHFNWLLNNIGQWLAYLSTLDQSFTWQNNELFSADPTIFGPAGTADDGSDARVQNAGAYSGFALYYSPLGPMPAGPSWNAFYNDGGSNFLPYKAGTPAFRSFLDPAAGLLRLVASSGAAALGTPLSWTDAFAVTPAGKVLINRTTDDGTGSVHQSNGAASGFSFYALPVGPSLDFFGFGWNCYFNPYASAPQYFSNEPAYWMGWVPAGVWNGSAMTSALSLRMGPGGANMAGTALFPTSGDNGPAIAFTPDGRMFLGNVAGGFFTDDGSGAKVQIFGGVSAHGDVSSGRVLAGTTDDKTGATVQGKAISEGGQLLANRYLGISAQAVDSAKLGGQPASAYLTQSSATATYAPATASQQASTQSDASLTQGQSGNTLSPNLWAPLAGTYLIQWSMLMSSPNGAISVATYLMTNPANSSTYNRFSPKALVAATTGLFNVVVSGSYIAILGKGDLVYIAGDNSGGETIDILTGSYISAIRIA